MSDDLKQAVAWLRTMQKLRWDARDKAFNDVHRARLYGEAIAFSEAADAVEHGTFKTGAV